MRECFGFQGLHHIFVYNQRCIGEIDSIDICEEWARTHGRIYW